VKALAHESLAKGDAVGWFDRVYEQAASDPSAVPWADLEPNPSLRSWWKKTSWDGCGDRALVVGCGLGDDAECLSARGCVVTAFDLSPKAIAWAKQRFPESRVTYVAADLLSSPAEWRGAFDFVFEAYTVQSLPPGSAERARALAVLRDFLAPNGKLLVVARFTDSLPGRDDGPPWPLVPAELEAAGEGLAREGQDDFDDAGTRRVRAWWHR
jgi:SAM-dependent methyltransferase